MNSTIVLHDESACKRLYALLRANWRQMAQAGKPLAVIVSEHKAKRNGEQNRLYWATLREIADSAWIDGRQYSDEAWHFYFRQRFIGHEDGPRGTTAPISTTTLSVAEFAAYVDRIMQYAAEELGVELSAQEAA